MPKQNARIALYDIIRIFAAILVVLGHSTYLTITTDHGGINYTFETAKTVFSSSFFKTWLYCSAWVYRFHIPLFFMLAGSVFALRPETKITSLLIKKIRRLLVPFFLCGLFFMIPLKTMGGFFDKDKLPEIVIAFLTGHESGHLWFLPALFWCFTVFVLLRRICQKPIFLILTSLLFYLFHSDLPQVFFEFAFSMQYLIFFVFGFYFDRLRPALMKKPKTAVCLLIALTVLNAADTRYHFLPPLFFMTAGALLVYFLALICCILFPRKTAAFFIQKAADQTMTVYLLHDPLMIVILAFFAAHQPLLQTAGGGLYFFCRTIGVVALSIAIGLFIKKGKKYVRRSAHH
ncbi:MAG: acyltransferase [Alphaproteobacteria bacterium]|nr:acyltransferase [Alphaproteobacteria bacterium]